MAGNCHCPIYAVGTLNGASKRVNTKPTSWEDAKILGGASSSGVTVARSVFLSDHAAALATNTQKKYEPHVCEFRQAWKVSPMTAAKNMSIVKAFFEFALTNE